MESSSPLKHALGGCALLEGLPESLLDSLQAASTRRRYRKNTIIISKDDETDSIYLVETGAVRVYRDDERGRQVTLNRIGPGEIFGELAALSSEPRIATVESTEDTTTVVIPATAFLEAVTGDPSVILKLAQLLVDRVRNMTIDVSDLALLDVYGRVARVLLREAREEGDGRQVIRSLTHQEIANQVGSSREMVSRIMRDLKAGQYISLEGRAIVLERALPQRW